MEGWLFRTLHNTLLHVFLIINWVELSGHELALRCLSLGHSTGWVFIRVVWAYGYRIIIIPSLSLLHERRLCQFFHHFIWIRNFFRRRFFPPEVAARVVLFALTLETVLMICEEVLGGFNTLIPHILNFLLFFIFLIIRVWPWPTPAFWAPISWGWELADRDLTCKGVGMVNIILRILFNLPPILSDDKILWWECVSLFIHMMPLEPWFERSLRSLGPIDITQLDSSQFLKPLSFYINLLRELGLGIIIFILTRIRLGV